VIIVLKANREDIKTNLPRYFRTCIFCKCSNIDDECILFSIVKETNVTKKKPVCPSSIEIEKKKKSKPNRFSAGSETRLSFKAFNGNEDSTLPNQLLKFVVFFFQAVLFVYMACTMNC
jgi:hypothetical protein